MFRHFFHPACAILAWAGAVLMLSFAPAADLALGQNGKHVAFKATIEPTDPFSDMNDASRPKDRPLEFRRGETFLLTITGTLEKGWHTYPLTRRTPGQGQGQLSTLRIEGGENFQPIYPVRESESELKDDRKKYKNEAPSDAIHVEHDRPFTWTQEIYVKPTASIGKTDLTIKVRSLVCSDQTCVPEQHTVKVPIVIAAGDPLPPTAALTNQLTIKPSPPAVIPLPKELEPVPTIKTPAGPNVAEKPAGPSGDKGMADLSLIASVLKAITGGLLSLVTPCVFPMIPITVSYFLKQAEKRKPALALASGGVVSRESTPHASAGYSPVLLAAVYSGTIVLMLTVGGLALAQVFRQISVHYATNFILSAVFLFFALSLLGMYDITLPSWLQDKTAEGEKKGGLVGVFFMALTFSIISFACVGPVYGGFVALQATSQFLKLLLSVLAFSITFASPFFILAMFPSLMRSMPRAGSWMNTVKVVLGFLELAAMVKFARGAELNFFHARTYLLTFDMSLGIYIALALACGLYLLGVYRLPHDHDAPDSISVPRLMFSTMFIALGVYLMAGLFTRTEEGEIQHPRGEVYAWVQAFLLPEDKGATPAASAKSETSKKLVWHSKLKDALAEAEREKKLVFIDFTGTQCSNCKLNEGNIFPLPEVKAALAQHVLLKLYTDELPRGLDQQPDVNGSVRLAEKMLGSFAAPLYALVKPKGDSFDVVRIDPQGQIRDVPAFVKFLAKE